jgi:hypothetical protein
MFCYIVVQSSMRERRGHFNFIPFQWPLPAPLPSKTLPAPQIDRSWARAHLHDVPSKLCKVQTAPQLQSRPSYVGIFLGLIVVVACDVFHRFCG